MLSVVRVVCWGAVKPYICAGERAETRAREDHETVGRDDMNMSASI